MLAQSEPTSNSNVVDRLREPHRVIAIASSVGGIEALKTVVSALPADFPAAILVVQHLSANYESQLTQILARHTALRVDRAREGMELGAGIIYITPPDKHLIVNRRTLSLSDAPKEHYVRPSAEYTFKSLANSYREKAVAIVLTGCDGDGREGVQVISQMGGKVIAQDRATSKVFSMPENAIETGCVDLVLPIEEIADGIVNLVFS
ncbi:MAG: chemotaxis protein CheB [Pleurocapsa sp. MO_226.B13]|nr:chemotaxis protein CheB [Pleurocapsa sp. MO_226.B13]